MAKSSKMPGSAEDTEAAFYDAIGRADIEALMALWADEEEIVCIHPGASRLVGHAVIRASWEAIFERGGVPIRPLQLHVSQNMMTSVHSVVEQINRADDQQDRHILATNIYLKTPLGWRIAVHHASIAAGKISAEKTMPAMLH